MLNDIAKVIRGLSADAVEKAGSGHPGMPIGCAEIGAVLYGEMMDYDPGCPDWPDRDRFVLSAGHGSMLLYSLLHLAGFDLKLSDLKNFRQLDSLTPGHPEYEATPGVETTTGPLGQGMANAVGMAIAEKLLAARYNTDQKIIDHYTYTLLGDGCMMEGISYEAASLAGHLGLGKLIAIYDDNDISIAGSTDLTFTESVAGRFEAQQWHVIDDVDGHDTGEIGAAIERAREVEDRPSLIVARTHIAYGAPTKQDSSAAHGAALGEDEIRGLKREIGLPENKKFYIPQKVKDYFAERCRELRKRRQEWEANYKEWSRNNPGLAEEWNNAHHLRLPAELEDIIGELEIETPLSTRKASGTVLRKLADELPYLIGGSADLAPSNKTYLDKYDTIQEGNFSGRNFRFGVREHAMGAIANGLSLHGGLRPYTATFLVFSDYMRPAIRLAALMKQPLIYVFTHDSIYIGEDGPTHQPVEQLESLRLIPNLQVLRPADTEETKAAWLTAVKRTAGPTALILTRQDIPHIVKEKGLTNFTRGGYITKGAGARNPDVVLMASGSEVSLAAKVGDRLEKEELRVRIVSIPDRQKFQHNTADYLREVLGPQGALRVVLEAGVGQGWYSLLRQKDMVISVEKFGKSGPGKEVASDFGFEVKNVVNRIKNRL